MTPDETVLALTGIEIESILAERLAQLRQYCVGVSLIVLSRENGAETGREAVAAGADAFVSKERTVEELRNAIFAAVAIRSRALPGRPSTDHR
jgi:DNA-binding NarL/FixJ family response regulator